MSKEFSEPLKPEDDILFQWRLKRKLEEAKNFSSNTTTLSSINHSKSEPSCMANNLISQHSIQTNHIEIAKPHTSNLTNETKLKKSMETQTAVDSGVQTSVDLTKKKSTLNLEKMNFKSDEMKKIIDNFNADDEDKEELDLDYEEPTRDKINYLDVAVIIEDKKSVSKNQSSKKSTKNKESLESKPFKPNILSSSPIKSKSNNLSENEFKFKKYNSESYGQISKILKVSEQSPDLTRVSSLNEQTPNYTQINPPTRSINSPINFTAFVKENTDKEKIPNQISKSTPLNSISSSITNVTLSQSITNHKTARNSIDVNDCNKVNNKTITISNKEDFSELRSFAYNRRDEDDEEDPGDIFATDEILQILFRKSYYYQMKLK